MKMKSRETNLEKSNWSIVLRGPIIWLTGSTTIIISYVVGKQFIFPELSTEISSYIFGTVLATFFALSVYSCIQFWDDVYYCFIKNTLRPVVRAAIEWSLDDILTVLCDPSQMASCISALFVLPVTLYTLPTTPEQRAEVFRSAGLLPEDQDANEVLNHAGGWKHILPLQLQTMIQKINTFDITTDQSIVHESGGILDAATDDGTDSEGGSIVDGKLLDSHRQRRVPYSISPVYRKDPEQNKDDDNESHDDDKQKESSMSEELPQQQLEPHELLNKIIFDIVRMNIHKFCDQLQEHTTTPATITAITATTILIVQLMYSKTARICIKTIFHVLVTAGSSSALLGSIAAILIPVLQQRQQHHPVSVKTEDKNWPISWLSSVLATATAASKIPRSVLSNKNHVFSWKGALAAFVLFYFQQRRRRLRLERQI